MAEYIEEYLDDFDLMRPVVAGRCTLTELNTIYNTWGAVQLNLIMDVQKMAENA